MGLLFDAAIAWDKLSNATYDIDVAKNRKVHHIKLSFLREDFPHIVGMHYATDVDFGIRANEYYGYKLIPAILDKRLDDRRIERSRDWSRISGRLTAIINLEATLDNEFDIASFDYKKAVGYCKIKADYIIRDGISDDIYFVFLKSREEEYFCISAFKKESRDYFLNQQKMTVLYKAKTIDSVKTELFKHQRYDPGIISEELTPC